MQSKTQLIVVLLGSIAFGLLSFFGYSPDPKIIGDTISYADQAKEAISMKNWISLATVLISFGALLFAWWKGKSNRQTLSIFLLLAISFAVSARLTTPTRQVSATTTDTDKANSISMKIEVIKPLSKMDYWRRC